MKHLLIAAVLAATPAALAHELDGEKTVSAQQIDRAKELPATTIVRISKNDPSQVEVAFVKDPVRAGDKVQNLKFEKMAMNAEKTGLAYDANNELDATSSTSSWVFAAGGFRRPWYGYAGYRPWVGGGYGYPNAYYYNSYYSPYYRPMYTPYYNAAYYPSYAYAGYTYNYYPYYTYADAGYNYAYCGWMY